MENKQYYVYIMASKRDGMLYIGVINFLKTVTTPSFPQCVERESRGLKSQDWMPD
jgi:hypothetical protein